MPGASLFEIDNRNKKEYITIIIYYEYRNKWRGNNGTDYRGRD